MMMKNVDDHDGDHAVDDDDDDHDDHGDDDDAAKMIGATKYVKADKADEGIWFVFVFAFVTL